MSPHREQHTTQNRAMVRYAVIGLSLALSFASIGGCVADDSEPIGSLGATTLPLSADVQRATLADDSEPLLLAGEPESSSLAAPDGALASCAPGVELAPVPPFIDAGIWVAGLNTAPEANTSNPSGAITAQSSVLGGWGNGLGWVRSDNIPPSGAGTTTVSTTVNFTWMSAELLLWVPAFSTGGVGLTIELFDGGPAGALLGSCRMPLLDKSIPFGYLFENVPRSVSHSCTIHHGAGSGFLTSKVSIDTYATHVAPYGGFAQASAAGNVTTIRHSTCLDPPPGTGPLCPSNRPKCCETDDDGRCTQCIAAGQRCN